MFDRSAALSARNFCHWVPELVLFENGVPDWGGYVGFPVGCSDSDREMF